MYVHMAWVHAMKTCASRIDTPDGIIDVLATTTWMQIDDTVHGHPSGNSGRRQARGSQSCTFVWCWRLMRLSERRPGFLGKRTESRLGTCDGANIDSGEGLGGAWVLPGR